MALTKEKQFAMDAETLSALRELIPGDTPMTFKTAKLAERINTTVPRLTGSLARLSSRSLIDYETERGSVTIFVSHSGQPVQHQSARRTPLVCRECGAVGHNDEAVFCWKCGKPLRTPEQLLKDKFSAVLSRIPALYGANVKQADADMQVLVEIGSLAFKALAGPGD